MTNVIAIGYKEGNNLFKSLTYTTKGLDHALDRLEQISDQIPEKSHVFANEVDFNSDTMRFEKAQPKAIQPCVFSVSLSRVRRSNWHTSKDIHELSSQISTSL